MKTKTKLHYAVLIRDMEATTHTRLTVTEVGMGTETRYLIGLGAKL